MKPIVSTVIFLLGSALQGTSILLSALEECGCPIPTVTCASRLDALGCSHLVCNGVQGEFIEKNRCPSGAYDVHTINALGCAHFVAFNDNGEVINERWSNNCTQMLAM